MDMIFCVGPGHGAPAILASLWLEDSLGKFYLKYSRDRVLSLGTARLKRVLLQRITHFLMLIDRTLIDHYCSAWHAYKYIDPRESGAVLPIVHANGFKISERTIHGCMDNKELACLFTGYGYKPRFVQDLNDIGADMSVSMEWALREIKDRALLAAAIQSSSPNGQCSS